LSKNLKRDLKPLGDRAVVKPVEAADKTESGLILPDTANNESQEGVVLFVGPGRTTDDGKVVPVGVKAHDRVIYAKYGGSKVKIDGVEVLIVSEKDILAIIPEGEK
jgi:chaperonin GroES